MVAQSHLVMSLVVMVIDLWLSVFCFCKLSPDMIDERVLCSQF